MIGNKRNFLDEVEKKITFTTTAYIFLGVYTDTVDKALTGNDTGISIFVGIFIGLFIVGYALFQFFKRKFITNPNSLKALSKDLNWLILLQGITITLMISMFSDQLALSKITAYLWGATIVAPLTLFVKYFTWYNWSD